MSYLCQHPALGATSYATPEELLKQKEQILYAVIQAACDDFRESSPAISNALHYASLEFFDAIAYYRFNQSGLNDTAQPSAGREAAL